ncbi:MAG: hypothetical protein DLM65_05350, partial [Candidatus Aeolococcus gillhamiae]
MAIRARPTSSTPQETVKKLASEAHVTTPGNDEARQNRLAGLGPLAGLATGVGVGAVLGLGRSAGWRPGVLISTLAATVGALVGSNGPMTVLGVT